MEKYEIKREMESQGYTYKGENEYYIMFDFIKENESIWCKDFIKSQKCFVEYDPRVVINLKQKKSKQ
jgi:hypothetical protein